MPMAIRSSKRQEVDCPLSLQSEYGPASTLISVRWITEFVITFYSSHRKIIHHFFQSVLVMRLGSRRIFYCFFTFYISLVACEVKYLLHVQFSFVELPLPKGRFIFFCLVCGVLYIISIPTIGLFPKHFSRFVTFNRWLWCFDRMELKLFL